MPTYEYRCTDCGNGIEVVQRIGDEALSVCDVCGGRLRKVFHPAGIVFKGSGFYATDSRKAAGSSRDGKTAGKAPGDGSSKGSSAEGTSGKGSSEGSAATGSSGGSAKSKESAS